LAEEEEQKGHYRGGKILIEKFETGNRKGRAPQTDTFYRGTIYDGRPLFGQKVK